MRVRDWCADLDADIFNVVGAYVGERTPLFITRKE